MLNKGFLPVTLISLVFIFLIARGCGSSPSMSIEDVGVGVSNRTQASIDGQVLDLTADLDPAEVPEMVKQAYLKGAELKKEGGDLLAFVIQDLSNAISGVSTIDLNDDKTPDPILVVPEGNDEQMTFSIRVPDPAKVKTYPDDPQAWQDIAESQAIEVLSVTVYPRLEGGKLSRFDVEARPNQQLYESSHHHHYQGSFSSGLLTGMLVSNLFFNPWGGWYGPGFYGRMGYYSPGYYNQNYGGRDVDNVRRTRTTYTKSAPTSTAMSTASGKSVSSSLASQKSSAITDYKSSAIQKRDDSRVKTASGFGGGPSAGSTTAPTTAAKSSGWGSTPKAQPSTPSKSSSSWGRSSQRSSWGGGGSRSGK